MPFGGAGPMSEPSGRKGPRGGGVSPLVYPLSAAALWGGMYVASKYAFGAIPPLTLLAFRLWLGGALLWLVLGRRLRGRAVEEARRPAYFAVGLLLLLALAAQFVGTDLASASAGALVTTTTPAFVVLFAWAYLRESLSWQALLGFLLAMVGAAVAGVGAGPGVDGGSWAGTGLLLLSSAAFAGYTVYGAPLVRQRSSLLVLAYAVAWAALLALPLAALEVRTEPLGPLTLGVVTAALYVAVFSTAVAWYLWYRGVEEMKAGVSAAAFFAQPVVGGLLAWGLLGERIEAAWLAGGLLVVTGISVVARSRRA